LRAVRISLALVAIAAFTPSPAAQGSVPHTVQAGETLWSIAAANNFTTHALAASNGLSDDGQVVIGATIQVPSEPEAAAALAGTAPSTATAEAPRVLGAYTVRPGDTLSSIAASSGIGVGQLAWMNGLDVEAPLLTGTALKLPTGAPNAEAVAPAPADAPQVVPQADPLPTTGRVTAPEIGSIAASHGVSPSLAAAVAWQESGFNNAFVSPANARGVMQILPGTWTWVEQQLADRPLDPASPHDNVQAGVMYLDQLIADAGGDEALAVASYYQGAASVRRVGLLPDTQRYTANVMALRSRFGN
jgi:N-acetylmuramoyl-L-alanine amidase